jgi:alpha-tubulin suppressor-like RCC1 family protein
MDKNKLFTAEFAANSVARYAQVCTAEVHSCGLRTDGTIDCWGAISPPGAPPSDFGEVTPPAGTFASVSAGMYYTCGLKTTGTIACWGANDDGQATPPAGTFASVSTGRSQTCGVKIDGTIACWGRNDYGQATPPAGTFPGRPQRHPFHRGHDLPRRVYRRRRPTSQR